MKSTKVFKIDTDEYVDYYYKVYWCQTICCGFPNLLCCCCVHSNLTDFANSVTVTVTDNELKYEREKIKTCWRLSCCDAGRIEKNIAIKRIIDVALIEPAGGIPPETLYRVKIQTASNSGVNLPELKIVGLKKEDAEKLKKVLIKRRDNDVMDRV